MEVDVCKFGGSSLANPKLIKHVGSIVEKHKKQKPTIIVLSAMYKQTQKLIELANEVCNKPKGRELDLLLTTGEQISVSLLSLYLNSIGIKSKALTARDIDLKGNGEHQKATLKSLNKSVIKDLLSQNIIPIITGFQVILDDNEIATMERGGSDTTAVGIAAAFSANCYIYSDVDGVYSADPKIIHNAFHWQQISYKDMMLMSSIGAKVLQLRAIEQAKFYKVPIILRSTFNSNKQTLVHTPESNLSQFFGISVSEEKYIVSVSSQQKLEELLEYNIEPEEIISNIESNQLIFPTKDFTLINTLFSSLIKSKHASISSKMVKLSLVGFANINKVSLIKTVIANKIDIKSLNTSNDIINIWVHEKYAQKATELLHSICANNSLA